MTSKSLAGWFIAVLLMSTSVLLCCAGCHGDGPLNVDPGDLPGRYVLSGQDFRDDLLLSRDGTFQRTAVYYGVHYTQSGRWVAGLYTAGGGTGTQTAITFMDLQPPCLGDPEVDSQRIGPDTDLCAGRHGTEIGAFVCYEKWRESICFNESTTFRFRRQRRFLGGIEW
jgi:hypothetical protein